MTCSAARRAARGTQGRRARSGSACPDEDSRPYPPDPAEVPDVLDHESRLVQQTSERSIREEPHVVSLDGEMAVEGDRGDREVLQQTVVGRAERDPTAGPQ